MSSNIGSANISKIRLRESSAPSTPASGYGYLYAKTTGLFFKGDDGVEVGPLQGGFIGCAALRSGGNQSISHNSLTAVQFDAADEYDTNGFHDPSSNNTRLTVPAGYGGYYRVSGQVAWDGNSTGARQIRIRKNGTTTLRLWSTFGDASTAGVTFQVSGIVNLAAADYIEMMVFQNSGGALNISDFAASLVWLELVRVGV